MFSSTPVSELYSAPPMCAQSCCFHALPALLIIAQAVVPFVPITHEQSVTDIEAPPHVWAEVRSCS